MYYKYIFRQFGVQYLKINLIVFIIIIQISIYVILVFTIIRIIKSSTVFYNNHYIINEMKYLLLSINCLCS